MSWSKAIPTLCNDGVALLSRRSELWVKFCNFILKKQIFKNNRANSSSKRITTRFIGIKNGENKVWMRQLLPLYDESTNLIINHVRSRQSRSLLVNKKVQIVVVQRIYCNEVFRTGITYFLAMYQCFVFRLVIRVSMLGVDSMKFLIESA